MAIARQRCAAAAKSAGAPADIEPSGGRFLTRSYTSKQGRLAYKLYVPSRYHGEALALVVMLHGCTQSADDFAAGTRMNALAEQGSFLVAYPEQTVAANGSKCWNWFDPRHQYRDRGEPALIAGLTREIMHAYAVDRGRVYVAGLSAGAAAAAVLADAYPDLYAAVGMHSGLPSGSATNVASALAAMRNGAAARPRARTQTPPTIVFHGDCDTTVHPSNAHRIADGAVTSDLRSTEERGRVPGGHAYRRVRYADADGRVRFECWDVQGAAHAWSGGSPAGSYTDPRGPDASHAMVRFFLAHRNPIGGRL